MTGFADMLRRIAQAAQQERPSDADLHDLGLSRADFEILTSGLPGARNRLVAMAATFGLSEGDIDRERGIALEAAETCAHCDHAAACQRALEGKGTLPVDDCPNAALYRMLSAG